MSRHWLLALAVVAFVAVLALSTRPWAMTNRPGFDRIATLPAAAQRPVRGWLDEHGIKLPWPGLPETAQPVLAVGYGYREVSALKLPLLAYRDPGLVVFDARGRWGPTVPLDAAGEAAVTQLVGQAFAADYRFPWWRYVWGWLLFVPLAGWYWLQVRAERRRADAAGMM